MEEIKKDLEVTIEGIVVPQDEKIDGFTPIAELEKEEA